MPKKKSTKPFTPLSHVDLDIKNGLLDAARNYRKDQKLESILASAFIYASLAEYLANNLLINLRHFTYTGSYIQYAAIIFIDEREDERNRTLGNIVQELNKYEFPDKKAIIEVLQGILNSRNNIFHNLAKANQEEFRQIFEIDIKIVQTKTEELISKINILYAGLQKILIPQNSEAEMNKGRE